MNTFLQIVATFVALLTVTQNIQLVQSWGELGHIVTARIAENLVTDDAQYMVNYLLHDTMPDVSMWADQIKSNVTYNWTSTFHTANIAEGADSYVPSRDCPAQNCVPDAITNYTMRLGNDDVTLDEQTFALKMIVHLYGDIHQPMNIAYLSDNHGLDDKGMFFDSFTNLQEIHQQTIIQQQMDKLYNGNTTQFVNALMQQFNETNVEQWTSCQNDTALVCPVEWASESAYIVFSSVYINEQGGRINSSTNFTLSDVYYEANRDDLSFRLIQGGVRLANALNVIGKTWRPPPTDQGRFGIILVSALCAGTAIAAAGALFLCLWRRQKGNNHSLFKYHYEPSVSYSPTANDGDYSRMVDA